MAGYVIWLNFFQYKRPVAFQTCVYSLWLPIIYETISNHQCPIECAIPNWIFAQDGMAFSVRWSASLGARRLVSVCESPRVQLRCHPNIISRPVVKWPDARVQLFTAYVPVFNSKENTIKCIITNVLFSLNVVWFVPSGIIWTHYDRFGNITRNRLITQYVWGKNISP